MVVCHLMQIVFFFQSEMPEAFNIGSLPFLWLVCNVVNITIDAVRYRMLYLPLLFCLSHTYGMVIVGCLPLFQPFLWLVCYVVYIAIDAVRYQTLVL